MEKKRFIVSQHSNTPCPARIFDGHLIFPIHKNREKTQIALLNFCSAIHFFLLNSFF